MAEQKCEICGGRLDAEGKCPSCESLLGIDLEGLPESPEDSGDLVMDGSSEDADVDLDSTVKEVSDEINLIMDAFKKEGSPVETVPEPPSEDADDALKEAENAQESQETDDSTGIDLDGENGQTAGEIPGGGGPAGDGEGLEGEFAKAAEETSSEPSDEDLGAVGEYVESAESIGDIANVAPLPDEPAADVIETKNEVQSDAAGRQSGDAGEKKGQYATEHDKDVKEKTGKIANSRKTGSDNGSSKGFGASSIGAGIAVILGILLVPAAFMVLALASLPAGIALLFFAIVFILAGVVLYFIGRKKG